MKLNKRDAITFLDREGIERTATTGELLRIIENRKSWDEEIAKYDMEVNMLLYNLAVHYAYDLDIYHSYDELWNVIVDGD